MFSIAESQNSCMRRQKNKMKTSNLYSTIPQNPTKELESQRSKNRHLVATFHLAFVHVKSVIPKLANF